MTTKRSIGIKGTCADCNEEIDLIAGKADGSEGVCWQCVNTATDHAFYQIDGYGDTVLTQAGRAALAKTEGRA